jgi:thiamine biosynthesis protein ThiS
MKITLNNRSENLENDKPLSISELINIKNFTFKFLAVRVNGTPIKPNEFDSTYITDGDNVIVMHLISGG